MSQSSLPACRAALLIVIFLLLSPAPGVAGPLQDDLRERRARAMEKIGPDTAAVFWSAPVRVYSHTVNYPYRQDSNLFYLTGIDQEDTILVLMPGNETRKAILFIRPPNPRRDHWEGPSLTTADATALSGIETVLMSGEFEPFVAALFSGQAPGGPDAEYARFLSARSEGRARLGLMLERQNDLTGPLGRAQAFAAQMRERFASFTVVDTTPIVHELRQTKTPYEQDVLRRSVAISNEAQLAGMRAAAPGRFEYEVQAAIESTNLRKGARGWGYPPIVGSGPNATILHYTSSSRRMEDGDLLLVDAAASYQGYTGDITRTYPINGRFSAPQRELYEIVLAAQEAGMRAVGPGVTFDDVQAACDQVIRDGLLKLGLIVDASGAQHKVWSTHGFLHFIGLDVHDVSVRRQVAPGSAFVIEPGIYIREAALDALPRTPENLAFIEKVRPQVLKYRDIGVRVEDSFLFTAEGLERLSKDVPRTVEEIERFLQRGRDR